MTNYILYFSLFLVAGSVIGFVLSALFFKSGSRKKVYNAKEEARKLIEDAEKEASSLKKETLLEAKSLNLQYKTEADKELKEKQSDLNRLEKRLRQREEIFDKKLVQIDKKESDFSKREKELIKTEKEINEKNLKSQDIIKEQTALLERISNLSTEDAKKELLLKVEDESRYDAAKIAKRVEDEVMESADKKCKHILSTAVQRYASDFISDYTVSAVSLPSDEMKGRIIGREGRNIRALESATGVEFIIDDTPETVLISCFDPVRREIARISLERLTKDGRIHPARIEEIVKKVKKEVDATIKEEGEKTVFDLGLHGIHPEIIKLVGRLKYRTSYGQNVLEHSREVAHMASLMAGELGVNIKLAKRAGILHDIGKAIDHDIEGSHQAIGADMAKKYGENNKIVNAIAVHHGEGEPLSVEAPLVAAADALSAARPGARKESMEGYLKRLRDLEEIATSFDGVNKSYAIQAGREIRIIVKPDEVNDDLCAKMSRDLAKNIEEKLTYPGQIKVTVVRESRYVEYAK
jgi:ribonuclease Y